MIIEQKKLDVINFLCWKYSKFNLDKDKKALAEYLFDVLSELWMSDVNSIDLLWKFKRSIWKQQIVFIPMLKDVLFRRYYDEYKSSFIIS